MNKRKSLLRLRLFLGRLHPKVCRKSLLSINLIFLFLFSQGCAGVQKRFTSFEETQRARYEASVYYDTVSLIIEAMPKSARDRCGIILNAPIPPTERHDNTVAMSAMVGFEAVGVYDPNTLTVHYVKGGSIFTLAHEFIHYIDDISNLTPHCKSEMMAYLGGLAYKNQGLIERWKSVARDARSDAAKRRLP